LLLAKSEDYTVPTLDDSVSAAMKMLLVRRKLASALDGNPISTLAESMQAYAMHFARTRESSGDGFPQLLQLLTCTKSAHLLVEPMHSLEFKPDTPSHF
jgi:hypothetical protein